MNEIAIYLTQDEAEEFKEFQKHYEIFTLLINKNVFDQKNSSVTMHFDHQGTLRTIQRADVLYSKKHVQKI